MRQTLGQTTTGLTAFMLLVGVAISCWADGRAVAQQSDRRVEPTIERLEQLATQQPKNPESWYTLAASYSEKAKNTKLPKDVAKAYVKRASETVDRALTINPDYYEALRLKTSVLRRGATFAKDSAERKRLNAEADAFKHKADEILALYGPKRG